jgi:hypothetical protein
MRSFHFLQRAAAACAVVSALALGGAAHANTLDATAWLNGSINLDLHRNGGTQNVNAGGFTGMWHSGGSPDIVSSIAFWCFELDQNFNLGVSYPNYTPSHLGGTIGAQLARLFQEAFSAAATTTVNSVAFQLAVWELEYDPLSLDVNSGSFTVTGGAQPGMAARTQANTWLTGLTNYSGANWSITQLSHYQRQDFIVGNIPPSECCNRVPEPPVLPLVLAGIGAVALIESRRRLRSRGE